MYIKRVTGYVLPYFVKSLLDTFEPATQESNNWKSSKPPNKWFYDKMMFGGIFFNKNGKLPNASGRIWYEADINYYEGKRNSHRIYFSNDGLIFVSYDHGDTFYEIV